MKKSDYSTQLAQISQSKGDHASFWRDVFTGDLGLVPLKFRESAGVPMLVTPEDEARLIHVIMRSWAVENLHVSREKVQRDWVDIRHALSKYFDTDEDDYQLFLAISWHLSLPEEGGTRDRVPTVCAFHPELFSRGVNGCMTRLGRAVCDRALKLFRTRSNANISTSTVKNHNKSRAQLALPTRAQMAEASLMLPFVLIASRVVSLRHFEGHGAILADGVGLRLWGIKQEKMTAILQESDLTLQNEVLINALINSTLWGTKHLADKVFWWIQCLDNSKNLFLSSVSEVRDFFNMGPPVKKGNVSSLACSDWTDHDVQTYLNWMKHEVNISPVSEIHQAQEDMRVIAGGGLSDVCIDIQRIDRSINCMLSLKYPISGIKSELEKDGGLFVDTTQIKQLIAMSVISMAKGALWRDELPSFTQSLWRIWLGESAFTQTRVYRWLAQREGATHRVLDQSATSHLSSQLQALCNMSADDDCHLKATDALAMCRLVRNLAATTKELFHRIPNWHMFDEAIFQGASPTGAYAHVLKEFLGCFVDISCSHNISQSSPIKNDHNAVELLAQLGFHAVQQQTDAEGYTRYCANFPNGKESPWVATEEEAQKHLRAHIALMCAPESRAKKDLLAFLPTHHTMRATNQPDDCGAFDVSQCNLSAFDLLSQRARADLNAWREEGNNSECKHIWMIIEAQAQQFWLWMLQSGQLIKSKKNEQDELIANLVAVSLEHYRGSLDHYLIPTSLSTWARYDMVISKGHDHQPPRTMTTEELISKHPNLPLMIAVSVGLCEHSLMERAWAITLLKESPCPMSSQPSAIEQYIPSLYQGNLLDVLPSHIGKTIMSQLATLSQSNIPIIGKMKSDQSKTQKLLTCLAEQLNNTPSISLWHNEYPYDQSSTTPQHDYKVLIRKSDRANIDTPFERPRAHTPHTLCQDWSIENRAHFTPFRMISEANNDSLALALKTLSIIRYNLANRPRFEAGSIYWGAQINPRPYGIPSHWISEKTPCDTNETSPFPNSIPSHSWVYTDPDDKRHTIILMPGSPYCAHPTMRAPYILHGYHGVMLSADSSPADSQENTIIPLEIFQYRIPTF